MLFSYVYTNSDSRTKNMYGFMTFKKRTYTDINKKQKYKYWPLKNNKDAVRNQLQKKYFWGGGQSKNKNSCFFGGISV